MKAAMTDLRALAEAATPGPWFYDSYSRVFSTLLVQADDDNCEVASVPPAAGDTAHGRHAADAAYIAAVYPDVVLRLLDVVDAAREIQPTRYDDQWATIMLPDLDALRDALDRLDR
jgi:hypothetical protein